MEANTGEVRRGRSAPERRAKEPFSAAKFAAKGGRSGPGWRR